MWGRRSTGAPTAVKEADVAGGARALAALDGLLRRARWEQLSEAERATLLSAHAPLRAEAIAAGSGASLASPAAVPESDLQDWVAGLVAAGFQREAAQMIHDWLTDTAPDAHLFVGGQVGQGRRSLVASLAHRAMASQPAATEYCYVSAPTSLGKAYALPLPHGQGEAFARAFDAAMVALTDGWSDDSSDETATPQPQQLTQLVAEVFTRLQAAAPASAGTYLQQLRATFEALAARGAELPVSYQEIPTWLAHGHADPAESDGRGGAPVVVTTLLHDQLGDCLLRANGGVLVLPATDLIIVDGAWVTLSAALTNRALHIKDGWPPLPLSVRVVLIGDSSDYQALDSAPGNFERLFRYEAWCNPSVTWNAESETTYAALADGISRRYNLPPFEPSAVARLIEEGARRADALQRSYLTTNLLVLHDIAVEAGREARTRGAGTTSGTDMEGALRRRRELQSASARSVREAILAGQEITPTTGAAIGQINGLGIYEMHPSEGSFAVPMRITATVTPGRDGRLVDIERVANATDADHIRGEMTVEGYLAYRYGRVRPIHLVARIRFEQEHGTTGGDSASGAILFALLSALAEAPIRYSYAVTGAVGQYGEIQPIGGVNTKIEGFWELCRLRRAQGEQVEMGYGVLIPAINTRDLMLRADVAESIAREGWFHVWPISTVDEGLRLLTGMPAEQIHARVEQRLQRFHEASPQAGAAR